MKIKLLLFQFILLLSLFSVEMFTQSTETLYKNGVIFTADKQNSFVEAVVTSGNRIVFTGSLQEAIKVLPPVYKTIDLHGKLMLPGFIDNHVHFTAGGFALSGLDLRQAKSKEEFISKIESFLASGKPSRIVGGGWNHELWEGKAFPDKSWIDTITKDIPVFLYRYDGHCGLANSAALKLAGITKDSKAPLGGAIEFDKVTGEPTGILKDNAMDLVLKLIPPPTEEENYSAALQAEEHAIRNGFTSVQDISSALDLHTYQRLEKEGRLNLRIYTRLPISEQNRLIDAGIEANFGSDFLKIGSLKGFADGSLGSSTAWFFESYEQDSTTYGLPNDILLNGKLREWAINADKAHLQISIHAIGDRTNNFLLNLFEEIAKINPKWDRRHRIEHAQHLKTEDIKRFKELGVIVSAQPYHLFDDGAWAENRLGANRIKNSYMFNSLMKSGALVCFGSDWTVAPLNALLGIYAAVTRETIDGKNPNGWIPEEKITVIEAIRAYTINNAFSSYEEKEKGSIEIGKLADFVLLTENIFTINPKKIKDVKVLMTICDGKVIYEPK